VQDDNTRDSDRIELLGALRGEVMVFQHTAVHQISKGGMQVETSFPLQLDSLHDFRLTLGDRSIVVKGRVAHSRVSEFNQEGVTYRTGIEFIEPSEPVAEVISEFVNELQPEHAQEVELDGAAADDTVGVQIAPSAAPAATKSVKRKPKRK
jgi:hypothetical protein